MIFIVGARALRIASSQTTATCTVAGRNVCSVNVETMHLGGVEADLSGTTAIGKTGSRAKANHDPLADLSRPACRRPLRTTYQQLCHKANFTYSALDSFIE